MLIQIFKSLLRKDGFALTLVLTQEVLELGNNLPYWYLISRFLRDSILRGFIFAIKRFQLYWDQYELISILQ